MSVTPVMLNLMQHAARDTPCGKGRMFGKTVVINTAVTVLMSLLVSSIGTNFFSPDEVTRAQTRFWSLSVAGRFALVAVPLVLPYLILIFGRLVRHTIKGLVGWEYPADRSPWFVISRIAALLLVGGGCWMLSRIIVDLGTSFLR